MLCKKDLHHNLAPSPVPVTRSGWEALEVFSPSGPLAEDMNVNEIPSAFYQRFVPQSAPSPVLATRSGLEHAR